MIIRITNIGGLLSLFYLWVNYRNLNMSVNETNILSSTVIKVMHVLPLQLIIICTIICYVIYIKKNTGAMSYILYFCSIILFHILCKISMSTLMLEDVTNFFLFNITYKVPIELKLYYVADVVQDIMMTNPELMTNRVSLTDLRQFINNSAIYDKIAISNAVEIKKYIYELFNEYDMQMDLKNKVVLNIIFKILTGILITAIMYSRFSESITNIINL